MKQKITDSDLVEYVLEALDLHTVGVVETQLRLDRELRNRYFEIQASLEQQIFELSNSSEMEAVDGLDLNRSKGALFEKLGLDLSVRQPTLGSKIVPISDGFIKTRKRDGIFRFAAAAIVLFGLGSILTYSIRNWSSNGIKGPAIVVYDITDGAALNVNDIQSGNNVREVLYSNSDHYDGLQEAENYAEQLWNDYQYMKQRDPGSIKGKGFVVLDLVGNQGFAGFYDSAVSSTAARESLWLAGGAFDNGLPLAPLSGESGVFYFSLKEKGLKLSTLNEFVPVTRDETRSGI